MKCANDVSRRECDVLCLPRPVSCCFGAFLSARLDFANATRIAEQFVERCSTESGLKVKLLRDQTIERDFGWVCFYAPEDESILVADNAPFILDRNDGSIHVTGTAYPIEEYLESYARIGRPYPFAVPEQLVVLDGWKPGMLKISLTTTIRSATGMGLAEAKGCTDSVAAGNSVTLVFSSATDADKFCSDAQQLGALARRSIRYH